MAGRGLVRLTSGYTFDVLEEVEVLMTRKAFADFVARARDGLDITQKELGDAVDVDSQQVSRWENGRSLPSSRKLRRIADALKLTERFTLRDANTLQYQVTIDDPGTYTRPWTIAFPWKREPVYGMFEYACHEGNYAMRNILSGSRAAEKAAATPAK